MKSVVIVGSGVAGTVVARRLLSTGNDYRITMFEAGPDLPDHDRRGWLDQLMRNPDRYAGFEDDPRNEHEQFGLRGSRLFVKGGTTNHWGGWSLRFKPEDFELKSRTGIGADWPISYEQLAPFYTDADLLLGIEGDSGNDDPPRFGGSFPFPPAPYTLNDMPVIEALKRLGMSYSHMPMARNGDRCITTGTCRYCPVNARYRAAFDLSQLQMEYGDKIELRTDSPVLGIEMTSKFEAKGVRYLSAQAGGSELMEADLVVVCAGTVESTKLLLGSSGDYWKQGIGNDSDHVGRHLVGHPLIYAEGVRPGNPDRIEQELGFITLASRHYDTPEYQAQGKMLFGRVGDDSNTVIEREMLAGKSRHEIEEKMESGIHIAFEASVEQFESPENRVGVGAATDSRGLRTTEISFGKNPVTQAAMATHTDNLRKVLRASGCAEDSLFTVHLKPDGAHATSTCRMSDSERDGVVDKNLQIHGTDNVFVCSNAVFPNVTAVNPTLTLAALASRLASHIHGLS